MNGDINITDTADSTAIGMEHCDLILTDQDEYEAYEAFCHTLHRNQDLRVGDVGFEALRFKGAVMMWSPVIQADYNGYMYFLNSETFHLRVAPEVAATNGIRVHPEYDLLPNQFGRAWPIEFFGGLTCNQPRLNGKLTGLAD